MGYVVAPLVVARRGRRHGWHHDRPGPVNLLGVVPLLGGVGLILWAIASHYRASPDTVELTSIRETVRRMTPEYLVTDGAYGLTRNPLYLGGAAMWTGWAVLLGNLRVAAAASVLFTGLERVGIPFEERVLENTFGETYDEYRKRVPRWLSA
jgi:protein-S-isoprenylcysteine O-methyltransferase Ste14